MLERNIRKRTKNFSMESLVAGGRRRAGDSKGEGRIRKGRTRRERRLWRMQKGMEGSGKADGVSKTVVGLGRAPRKGAH